MWCSEPPFVRKQALVLGLIVTPADSTLTLPVSNGQTVATLQGVIMVLLLPALISL